MTVSEVVLSIVALRLAALVLAGLILQALPTPPPAAVQVAAIGATTQGASIAKSARRPRDGTDELLRDMLLHD
jgi:hypothetical protein